MIQNCLKLPYISSANFSTNENEEDIPNPSHINFFKKVSVIFVHKFNFVELP